MTIDTNHICKRHGPYTFAVSEARANIAAFLGDDYDLSADPEYVARLVRSQEHLIAEQKAPEKNEANRKAGTSPA